MKVIDLYPRILKKRFKEVDNVNIDYERKDVNNMVMCINVY